MSYDSGGMSEADAAGMYTRGLEQRLERANSELQSAIHARNDERRRAHDLEAQLTAAHAVIDAYAGRYVRVTVPEYGEYPAEALARIAKIIGQDAGRAMIDHAFEYGELQRRAAILEHELLHRYGQSMFPLMTHDGGLALEATKGGELHAELIRTKLELRKVRDEFAAFRLRDLRRPAVMA